MRNKQRIEILNEWTRLHAHKKKDPHQVKSLLGKIQSSRQIEKDMFEEKFRYLSALDKRT